MVSLVLIDSQPYLSLIVISFSLVAAMVYLIGALISDKYSIRWGLMFPLACVSIVGYILLCAVSNNAVKLFACFLAGAGIYICVGLHFTWIGRKILPAKSG